MQKDKEGIFDISDADGVNQSERLLMKLCRKSFLSLWAHANLHTDQDIRDGKGSAKEFADVLVLFGKDIIIFSDKNINFQQDKPLDVAWARWYKKAILSSANQLHGALSWIRRFPKRIFLDAKCTRLLPIELPPLDQARFHLIAITRGSFDACAIHFPGSIGSHQINTSIEGAAHEKAPFTVGLVEPKKHFIHVFDEFSLEVLMDEFDTAADFLEYIVARERFLTKSKTTVTAAGEEQLISAYILNGNEHGGSFLPKDIKESPDYIFFDETHYPSLKSNPQYKKMRILNRESVIWDEIIERFIRIGDPKLVTPLINQQNSETEQALRLIASESRFRRRILTSEIKSLFIAAQKSPDKRRARIVSSKQDPNIVYIFLVVPKKNGESQDEYRKYRASVLHAYVRCSKLRFKDGEKFIGMAFDHPVKDYSGGSEDLIVYICENWNDETIAEAEKYREMLGILDEKNPLNHRHDQQFPSLPLQPKKESSDKKRSTKAKRKSQSLSRRKNRKK